MKQLLILLLTLTSMTVYAQKINCHFRDISLSDALRTVQKQTKQYDIIFIYNDLEDFRVTTDVRQKSVMDAILQIVGFYPVRVYKNGKREIYVESTHKKDRHLTGKIIDEQGKPLAFANVLLLNPSDSARLNGGISNESGYFTIPYVSTFVKDELGKVLIRISYVGYKTVYRLCVQPEVGTIQMRSETQRLKSVTVERNTPVLRRESGMIIFDTRHIAGAVNAKDLLSYAPGVTIENDNISLFGAGSFILTVDGKEQKMQTKDLLQMLQTYSASDVDRIEIIQGPGASYSAEGNAGVINIALSRHDNDFIGGSVAYARTQYEEHGDEINANIIYNKGRISTSLNLAGTWDHTIYQETNMIDFPDIQRINTDNGHIKKDNYAFHWQMDYQLSRMLNLGAYVMYMDGERRLNIDGTYDYLPVSSGSLSSFNAQTLRKEDTKTWAVNVNAVQKTGEGGAKIEYNLDYYRMRMGDGRHSFTYETYADNIPDHFVRSDTASFDYTNNIAQDIDNYSAKMDVSYAGFKIGSQYVFTRSHLDLVYSGIGMPYSHVLSNYDEQVLAGYAEYGRRIGNTWSLNAGGRYEHTWTKGNNNPSVYDSKSSYGKFFPSLHVEYNPDDSHAFYWSISSRITRPNVINLNPNMVWKDVNHASFGNQNLKPTYLYKTMIGYSYKGMLNMDLYYTYQPDRIDAVYDVTYQRTISSWDNITDVRKTGINTLFRYDKPRWLTALWIQEIWYSKTSRKAKEIYPGIIRKNLYSRVEGVSFSERLQATIFFDHGRRWTSNIDVRYISSESDVSRKIDARYTMDVGIRYRFCKERLTASLTCQNLFSSSIKGTEYLSTTMMAFNNKFNYRTIYLTFTYQWGARMKHSRHRYESDEMRERVVNDF
ncbi:MAG: TonB-dependent receptor [Prevotella sp.]|nr:TonB-dependent receptor [Prevotella sp.]